MATTNPIDWEVKYKELAAKTDEYIKKNEATKLERAVVSLVEKLLGIEHVKLEWDGGHGGRVSEQRTSRTQGHLLVGYRRRDRDGGCAKVGSAERLHGCVGDVSGGEAGLYAWVVQKLVELRGETAQLKGQLKQLKKDIAEKEQRDKEEKEREENEEKDRVELEREDFENRVALLSKEEEVVTLLGQVYRDNQPVRAQINCNLPLLPLPHTLLPDHGQTISTSASQDLNVIKMRK